MAKTRHKERRATPAPFPRGEKPRLGQVFGRNASTRATGEVRRPRSKAAALGTHALRTRQHGTKSPAPGRNPTRSHARSLPFGRRTLFECRQAPRRATLARARTQWERDQRNGAEWGQEKGKDAPAGLPGQPADVAPSHRRDNEDAKDEQGLLPARTLALSPQGSAFREQALRCDPACPRTHAAEAARRQRQTGRCLAANRSGTGLATPERLSLGSPTRHARHREQKAGSPAEGRMR